MPPFHSSHSHLIMKYYLIILLIVLVFFFFSNSYTKTQQISMDATSSRSNLSSLAPKVPQELVYRGVVESMDGIGYVFKKSEFKATARFEELSKLPNCGYKEESQHFKIDIPEVMSTFKDCILQHIHSFYDDVDRIDHDWAPNATLCEEKLNLTELHLEKFRNAHESKYAVMPNCNEEHIMVTFGVGHEVSAELALNRTLPNVKFLGADPIIEPNIQLYSQFGRFFPFGVARQSGTDRFKVLPNQNQRTRKYMYQDVTAIEVVYVLKEIMKLSWIDFFWIDIEGGEIDWLDYFFKDGNFDRADITVCQFNMELHSDYVKGGALKFYQFLDRIVNDGRYLFLKTEVTGVGVYRMFFLNVENKDCIEKFLTF